MPAPNGCTGQCCRSFPIVGFTFKGFAALAQEYSLSTEYQKIASMIVPIESSDSIPRFTCLHFNEQTGLCNDYENRPLMCSDYPYLNGTCQHCNQTYVQINELTGVQQ